MSLDPGRAADPHHRTDLLEMYGAAISYLDSLRDPAVQPLREELTLLRRRLEDEPRPSPAPAETGP